MPFMAIVLPSRSFGPLIDEFFGTIITVVGADERYSAAGAMIENCTFRLCACAIATGLETAMSSAPPSTAAAIA